MELKAFVKKALVDIIDAVSEAQDEARKKKAVIAPGNQGFSPSRQQVHFDIALSEDSEKGTKGGIGVFLSAVHLGTQGESSTTTGSLSRISFDVPVVFPVK